MNKTAELVRLWAEFEESHPSAELEDFCLSLLVKKRLLNKDSEFMHGAGRPDLHSLIAKMTGRIAKLHIAYAMPILKKCGLNNFEDFLFLDAIYKLKEPRKTELINLHLMELSSGLLVIDRLQKMGLVVEEHDKEDKRSKRLKITKKGREVSAKCYHRMTEMNKMFFGSMPGEDLHLCIRFMTPVEQKFAQLWLMHKGKSVPRS